MSVSSHADATTPAAGKALLQIHFCVLLWGFTAILGKLISLQALALVWWRLLIVVAALLLVPKVWRGIRATPARLLGIYALIGCVIALHWLTFYGAIKLANASVAATCLALAPSMLTIVEPLLTGRRFAPREFLLGLAVAPGVALVVGGVPGGMRLGIAVGVLSALFVAIFSALNKRYVHRADAMVVTCVELGAGLLLLSVLAPLLPHTGPALPIPDARDAGYLLLLSIGCTLLPFTLSLVALRALSAFTTQLITSLEPVYAVLLAMPLLGEQRELSLAFYGGVALITATVFLSPWLLGRRPEKPDAATLGESGGVANRG